MFAALCPLNNRYIMSLAFLANRINAHFWQIELTPLSVKESYGKFSDGIFTKLLDKPVFMVYYRTIENDTSHKQKTQTERELSQ